MAAASSLAGNCVAAGQVRLASLRRADFVA